jgi:hypothetical protein
MPRSICVHPDHQEAIALALQRNGFLTQADLAAHLEIALSTVSNFFRGVKVYVSTFERICEALGLDKRSIALPQQSQTAPDEPIPPVRLNVNFYAYDDAWVGRDTLITELTQKLNGTTRLLMITGIAGIGKTALAERLFIEFQNTWLKGNGDEHDKRLIRENFDNQDQATDFSSVAARLLEKCEQIVTPDDRKDGERLLDRLFQHLQQNRYLVVIDSLEFILKGSEEQGWSEFEDAGFVRFFQRILAAETFQSRIILTSQELPAQILEMGTRYQNFWFCQPLTGLSGAEQYELFKKIGLDITPQSLSRSYLNRIGRAYEGHPLALRVIIGEIGSQPFYGNVVAYWNKYGDEIEEVEQAIAAAEDGNITGQDEWKLDRFTRSLRRNVRSRLEKTFARLQADARTAYLLLCETSVYRCPVPETFWLTHLEYWDCDKETQATALEILKERYLVEEVVNEQQPLIKQHNLIRSVALDHLKQLV